MFVVMVLFERNRALECMCVLGWAVKSAAVATAAATAAAVTLVCFFFFCFVLLTQLPRLISLGLLVS